MVLARCGDLVGDLQSLLLAHEADGTAVAGRRLERVVTVVLTGPACQFAVLAPTELDHARTCVARPEERRPEADWSWWPSSMVLWPRVERKYVRQRGSPW